MRITFIEPAAPGFHVYSFVKQLRLGLPLLGALLTERGHEVRIYAESLSEVDWDDVLTSDLVGISTTTSTAIRAYRYAQRVRDAGIPVVMGGPHVTFLADEAMDFCDYVVRNEGEETLIELVDYLEGRRVGRRHPRSDVPIGGGAGGAQPGAAAARLAHRSPLARHEPGGGRRKGEPHCRILASRGCPFGCEFCSRDPDVRAQGAHGRAGGGGEADQAV